MSMPVSVPMMKVGVVGMTVHEKRMAMPMHMRLAGGIGRSVFVLVVCVVAMPVFVLQRFVDMLVRVAFSHVQPDTDAHQDARRGQRPR